jgi:PAS domain S-box-containing protein
MRQTSADVSTTGLERSTLPRFRRAVALGTAGASGIALAGLLAYALGIRVLGSIRPDYIPMAPSTAICFLILSVALYGHDGKRWMGAARTTVVALVPLVAAFSLLEFIGSLAGLDLTGEDRLTSAVGTVGAIPVGRMSVATAAVFVIAALGTWLVGLRSWSAGRAVRIGHVASSLGVLTVLLGGTVLLGYVFGTPFNYAGDAVPMAATTAIAFLGLGMALAATAGPASLPVRMVVGDSFEAWLSRAFLALTASSLLTLGMLAHAVSRWVPGDEALVTSALIVVTCVVTAFVVARVVRRFGARLADSEQLRQESERRVRTVFENMPLIGLMLDRGGQLTFCNDALLALTGWSREEVMGRSWFELFLPLEIRTSIEQEIFAKALSDGTIPTHVENEILTRAGERRVIRWSNLVQRDHAALVTGVASIGEDITERKRAEEVLQAEIAMRRQAEAMQRDTRERLRTVLDTVGDPIFVKDNEHRLILVNQAFCDIFGLEEAAVLGKTLAENVPASERQHFLAVDRLVLDTGIPDVREETLTVGDFTRMIVTRKTRFIEHSGEKFLMGSIHDITERKRAEDARMHQAAELAESQRIARIGSWEWMLATNVVAWSDGMNHLVARAPGSPPPTFAELAQFYPPESWQRLGVAIAGAVESGTSYDIEVEMIRGDGATSWTTTRGEAVRGADGAVVKLRGTVLDITARKRAEEERASIGAQLRQAQKMESVGRLTGGIAHDFNNLLSVIVGWTGMVLDDLPADDQIRPALQEILSAGQRAAALTKQLLAFSRQQVGEPVLFSPNDLVVGMDTMLRRLIGEDIEYVTRTDPALGTVKMDRGQLEQVVMNLVVNARDAMPTGGKLIIETANIVLDAEYSRRDPDVAPGDFVMVAVSDSGVGMSDEVKSRLFEPFFTTKAAGKGTGLGLATSFGIVKQAGGQIDVYSEPGVGTSMKIYLPRQHETAQQAARLRQKTPIHGVETILLVEDEEAVRHVVVRMLEQQGYRVLSTANGDEALRVVEEAREPLHLLLTDVILAGGTTGPGLAEQVHALKPDLKVLFMSGYTGDIVSLSDLLAKRAMFLQKPFTATSLGEKVRQVLDTPEELRDSPEHA